jgi:tetratricopeptide (TPR) repeat protein
MYADSLGSYRKAVAILERLQGRAEGDRELRSRLAKALVGVGDACTRLNDKACAATSYRKANGLYELDARQNPGDFMAQARWLTSRITQLDPLVEKQEYGKMRDELRVVAKAYEELGKRHPGEAKLKPFEAYAYKRLGAAEGILGEYSAGIGWYEKAKELHRQGKDRTGESTCEVDIAWALERQRKVTEAHAALDRAILIRREEAVLRRNDPSSKISLASALFRKALLLQSQRQWVDAGGFLEEALVVLKPLESGVKQNLQVGDMLHNVMLLKGNSLWETGRRQEAMAAYKQALVFRNRDTPMVKQARKRLGQIGSSEPAKPSR